MKKCFKLKLVILGIFLALVFYLPNNTYSEYVSKITTTETGINGSVVTINDLEADYYYYMAQNYTDSDGSLPTLEDKKIYNENNLVETKITYYGYDIENKYHAYVSLREQQDTYVYYKMYPVNSNGTSSLSDDYIEIELIDNPFTDRPNDMGFNGWLTSYENVTISLDKTYYVRKAKIPVKYVDNIPQVIDIAFYSTWIDAKVGYINNSNTDWSNAFSLLDNDEMQPIGGQVAIYESVEGLYIQGSVSGFSNYPAGAVNNRGQALSGRCNSWFGSCTYYLEVESSNYVPTQTYYKLSGNGNNASMNEYEVQIIGYDELPRLEEGTILAGYYNLKIISNGSSLKGYYSKDGILQGDVVCNNSSGCQYYELFGYYDNFNNINKADGETIYYYLPTRDTNIIVMSSGVSTKWSSDENKPFTLTSIHNDINYTDSVTWNVSGQYITCYNDTVIENIRINSQSNSSSSDPSSGTSNRNLYANYNNVKIGRGIVQSGTYKTFNHVFGGNNNTSALGNINNVTKYRLTVESGFYNTITLTNGPSNNNNSKYIEAQGVYGNDYDRANRNNNNLDVYFETAGSWGAGNYYASTNTGITFDAVIKSGKYGTGKNDHTTGVYVGGRSYGTHYTSRRIKVEGGWIYNLIGGPLTASNRGDINDTYIYMTGGEIDMIIGGAGTSTTYGNRIIQVTGGRVNYSVFGGSNSYNGDSSEGKLTGSSYVYIGGTATIGNEEYISSNSTLWGAESGSVFGIGNGNTSSSTIGTNENSNVIIADECNILGSVYGGGNYSATGTDSRSNKTTTNILVNGGNVYGNVYGGGNRNGSGSSSIESTINIQILSGNILGSVFGGSRTLGTIHGNVNINVYSGNIKNIYGGGEGNQTYVSQNIDINFGNENYDNLILNNNLYGGSAYGTVNGTSTNSTNYNTKVVINNGEIKGSVFGGAQGDSSYTPYVLGNVSVTVNGGTVNNVFGGNDYSSTPSGTVNVYLNGGNINNVYGGGNKTSLTTSNIHLNGSVVGNIFGGSNETGDVNTSNIEVIKGVATTIYGGNNIGGNTYLSNITVSGGNVTTLYGGGKETSTTTSNIIINGSNIENIYGGGENAAVTTTNININDGVVGTIYGGSNTTGDVNTSNITINNGDITTIYGGNNIGGKTSNSIIKVEGATVSTIYGGGNDTLTDTSNLIINDGIIDSLYGGGNNENGTTPITTLKLNGGIISNVYGGGNKASTTTTNIDINGSTVINLYGGGNQVGITDSNIKLINGNITNLYGGSNQSGNVANTYITTNEDAITSPIDISLDYTLTDVNPYWQDTNYKTVAEITVTIKNNTDVTIENYDGYIKLSDSILYSNYSSTAILENNGEYYFNEENIHYETNKILAGEEYSFTFSIYSKLSKEEFKISEYKIVGYNSNGDKLSSRVTSLDVENLYGGNNEGGITNNSYITLNAGKYGNIYGGGNLAVLNTPNINLKNIEANNIYGGGNQATVTKAVTLRIINSNINGSIYGGGNLGAITSNTNVHVSSSNILGNIYGGGNGTTAIVSGKTNVLIDDNTSVNHVFGGGNAANTGIENSNTISEVNIAGATINGNVYGGGSTSVVYGSTVVNIGIDTIDESLVKTDILINGTVFGGGEANEEGSEVYDFSFISVTNGTEVNINGNNHDNFNINGSIFGSGNASSTEGSSYINISNYGNSSDYKTNISIQRADLVTIDNSAIELKGATDRTNEYSTVLFSISRIKHLKLKNNSTLYLQSGANLLEEYTSAVDVDGIEQLASISINNGEIAKNVENNIYMLEGKNLNIATNENATAYGKVNGMTFFGMYIKDRNGKASLGMYNTNYNNNDLVDMDEVYQFTVGSYVLGLHAANHDITKNGFYTNYAVDGLININYITPTPDDSTYYMWSIGEQVVTIETTLTASKYLTLGTEELAMLNYSNPNTVFSIVGFNYNNLDPNVSLVMEQDIPRVAENTQIADNVMGLVMKSTNNGWITDGETTFLTSENSIVGTTLYKSENSTQVPTFQLYIYHSKNLGSSGKLGNVVISFMVITPIDEINNKVERVNLIVNLNRELYTTNDYEAAMTNGKEYDLFTSTNVNLTTKGSLSAYYSLFVEGEESIYKDGYHRSLVSTYVFPVDTKITLINLNEKNVNEYYYYIVTEENIVKSQQEYELYGECSYDFSDFIRMGSTSLDNNYDDEVNNSLYFDDVNNISHEEFIVIVDFVDSNINTNVLDKSLLLELRNSDNKTIVNVLGIEQEKMYYSLYTDSEAIIDVTGKISSQKIYPGDTVNLNVTTNFNRSMNNSEVIYDTRYLEQKLGVRIYLLDKDGNQVTGASLLGLTYEYDGVKYYPTNDGSVRINLAEQVANVSANIKINTTDSVAAGNYTMIIESFGSSDGIYYGLISSDKYEFDVTFLDTVYGLSLSMGDYLSIIDKKTGNNLNGNNDFRFNLKYSSSLSNPNIRISLYKRDYSTIYSTDYELVDLQDYLIQDLTLTNNNYEYLLTNKPLSDVNYSYKFKDNLKSGTYKFMVSLYDNNTYIGSVYKYIIIKEAYSE